jgi:hypothetical protein
VQCRGIGRQLQRLSSGSTPHDRVTIPQICSARSLALDRPRQPALRFPDGVSNRPTVHRERRDPPPVHQPLHRRTTCRIDSIPTTHLTRGSQISITSAEPPSVPLRAVSLYGLLSRRRFKRRQVGASFPSSVSLFDLKAVSSSRPALRLCWRAQKLSRLAVARINTTGSAVARPHLDSFEHDGTVGAIGITIGGEPACGRDQSRHNLVFDGSKDPNHDAVMRIGSEAPKRRTHSPFRH